MARCPKCKHRGKKIEFMQSSYKGAFNCPAGCGKSSSRASTFGFKVKPFSPFRKKRK